MSIQWDIVPVLAETFEMSRSEVRRKLTEGAFYLRKPTGWERVPSEPDDVFEADGVPARAALRFGKRRVQLVTLS